MSSHLSFRGFTRRALLFVVVLLAPVVVFAQAGDDITGLLRLSVPEKVDICGDEIPIRSEDVYERLQLEMMVVMGNPVQTALWLKRMPRVFPLIEAHIKEAGLPEDLKYIAVAESNLRADALSRAGASGPWQFMRNTGRHKGLTQSREEDQRRNWEKSTVAALDYLKELHDEFGNWPLALAAYNAGRGRIKRALNDQEVDDYFGLKLSAETERYLFRILAVKLLAEDPALFGIEMDGAELYAQRDTITIDLDVERRRLPIKAVAESAGVSYRYLIVLNPWMTGGDLKKGSYQLTIPLAGFDHFTDTLFSWDEEHPEPKYITYRVRNGDNLIKIAKKHTVTLRDLLSTNGLKKRTVIHPGQKLIIPAGN